MEMEVAQKQNPTVSNQHALLVVKVKIRLVHMHLRLQEMCCFFFFF
jgi:hypothetical protein